MRYATIFSYLFLKPCLYPIHFYCVNTGNIELAGGTYFLQHNRWNINTRLQVSVIDSALNRRQNLSIAKVPCDGISAGRTYIKSKWIAATPDAVVISKQTCRAVYFNGFLRHIFAPCGVLCCHRHDKVAYGIKRMNNYVAGILYSISKVPDGKCGWKILVSKCDTERNAIAHTVTNSEEARLLRNNCYSF